MNAETEDQIRRNVPWDQVPSHIKNLLHNSSKVYGKDIVSFSIKNQLRYRGNLVKQVLTNEKRYYERVVAYSIERLMLFPYHLADMIVKGLRITPFNYYVTTVEKLIQAERSYDTLPNFTAADCLRLLGIGRNEYIDIMNRSRSNRSRLFGKRNVRGLLPRVPCDIHIEPWWRVELGMVLEDDVKLIGSEELQLIDLLIDCGSQTAVQVDRNALVNLYKKGLVYLDVPVTAFDRVQVPPLQGFVMNRVLGDYFETLLYKIFVSIDEHMTIGELANVLDVDVELVKQAVSLYIRLGFARKMESDVELDRRRQHPSWDSKTVEKSTNDLLNECLQEAPQSSPTLRAGAGRRIAFLFDSALTAFLMMGNLSPGLKKHAVTMFEVGKLCDESLDSFLLELEKVSLLDAEGEGEARRFFDHAVILRSTVLALKKLPSAGLDLIRLESLHSLEEAACNRLLQIKYKLLVSMAPLSREVRPVCSLSPPHLGPAIPQVNSIWFKMFLYHVTGYGPPTLLLIKETILKQLPRVFLGYSKVLVSGWLHEPAMLPVANILHVNAALQYSPVLIQAYGTHQTARIHLEPLPLRAPASSKGDGVHSVCQWRAHPAMRNLNEYVDLDANCGYVTFVDIGVPDFGCTQLDPQVKLRRERKHTTDRVQSKRTKSPENLTLVNDNFTFDTLETSENRLQSPVENHFASSPTLVPRNGFVDCNSSQLMSDELDQLEQDISRVKLENSRIPEAISFDSLTSPTEENISMFSRAVQEDLGVGDGTTITCESNKGETWTLLDCHFGIPLFDPDANTKICDSIVSGGLAESDSLERLTESSRKLGSALLQFISQCQSYTGENTGIIKRGSPTPFPKHNLVFNNGRIHEWTGD